MKTIVSKKWLIVVLMLIYAVLMSGCYMWEQLDEYEYGVRLEAGKIIDCVGPGGQYTDMGWFADLRHVSGGALTFEVMDPEVLTADTQPVGVLITVQAKRDAANCDQLKNLVISWPALLNDEAFIKTISATANEGIKNGTRDFTLGQLVDDRDALADAISQHISNDAGKYSALLVNVTIKDVNIDDGYVQILLEQAKYTAEIDKERKRQALVTQKAQTDALEQEQRTQVYNNQLKAEEALTSVQVEIARRKGEIIKAENQVYVTNEFAFELERLRLMKEIFGSKSVFYFLPENTDLTLLFNPGSAVPVPVPEQ